MEENKELQKEQAFRKAKSNEALTHALPIQLMSDDELAERTEDCDHRKTLPTRALTLVGRVIHAGTFDSRDFCTMGFEIILSRELTISNSRPIKTQPTPARPV